MPIEIHEVEIAPEPAATAAPAPSARAGTSPAPSRPQSAARQLAAARQIHRELVARAARLAAD